MFYLSLNGNLEIQISRESRLTGALVWAKQLASRFGPDGVGRLGQRGSDRLWLRPLTTVPSSDLSHASLLLLREDKAAA